MNPLDSKITILVNSCDAYSDIWPLFFSAVEDYWPNHVNIVLNSETIKCEDRVGVDTHLLDISRNNDSWGFRLRETLKDIKTEYVLVLFDDFIMEDYIDEDELLRIVNAMENDSSISVVYLTKMAVSKKNQCNLFCEENKNKYVELENNVDFRLNSAPAIWRVQELIKYTGVVENPWAWEVFGTYKTFNIQEKFYCVSDSDIDVFKYNYNKGGAIYRGKWVSDVVLDKNEKYQLNIDFNKRGFSNSNEYEKRNFLWKIAFLKLGYKMVGLKFIYFIVSALKRKIMRAG